MRRWPLLAAFAVGVACGGGETSTTEVSTTGTTSFDAPVSVPTSDAGDDDVTGFPRGTYGAGWSSVGAGIGYLHLASDGTGSVRALGEAGLYEVPFTYTVDGEEISFVDSSGECDPGVVGSYRWSVDDEVLEFASVSDRCLQRLATMTDWDWYPLRETPVVEARPGGEPVSVASEIGGITWHVVEGHDTVVAFGDGFASLSPDEGGTAQVVTSDDGLTWVPIPDPPGPPEVLAARADELYVGAFRAPTEVYVTTDRGVTWTPVGFDSPPTGVIGDLVAGPAGVILTTIEEVPPRPTTMPPANGVDAGQTVRVTLSGISGHSGHDLAVVLYEGDQLDDLDSDGIGGLWSVVSGEEFTMTEIVRAPATPGTGPFPYVSDQVLTVRPGRYTLVIWVDVGLGPATRWVPVNTDGQGLVGCQTVIDVGSEAQTEVTVSPTFQPDGWNTDCSTGEALFDTDASGPVAPHTEDDPLGVGGPPDSYTKRVWALGSDSFEPVERDLPEFDTILPVDSGFFAAALPPGTCWTSGDGRTWTETPDSCSDIFVQSSFRDRVYGATDIDEGVASTDGGRTWGEPVVRPGGPGDWLTVGEIGYVAVETALFAPPVGVVWASSDDVTWERVLNPWPPPLMGPPVISGNTILIPSELCDVQSDECRLLDWVGVVDAS